MSGFGTFRKIGYGFLLGTAGVKLLTSRDAKKFYTHVTAAVMRCGDEIMKTFDTLKENCGDIETDAREINEARKEEERRKEIEDARAVLEEAEADEKATGKTESEAVGA